MLVLPGQPLAGALPGGVDPDVFPETCDSVGLGHSKEGLRQLFIHSYPDHQCSEYHDWFSSAFCGSNPHENFLFLNLLICCYVKLDISK